MLTLNSADGRLGPVIIDIHTHTYPISDDSLLMPEQLISEAKRLGLDGVCITEHDGFWAAEDIEDLSRAFDFPIFPGCEVTTEDGHLLVYGLRRYIFGMHRSSFVKRLVDAAGGVIVVAHPYRRTFRPVEAGTPEDYDRMLDRACGNDAFSLSDAVEVLNGRGSESENDFSHRLADRLGMNGTGASDAHRLEDIGTFATEFERPVRSLDDFISELRAGRFRSVVLDRAAVSHAHP